jgi:hypothetical protein
LVAKGGDVVVCSGEQDTLRLEIGLRIELRVVHGWFIETGVVFVEYLEGQLRGQEIY